MISLANKYRPKEFSECVGQEATTTILSQQIKTNNTKNAYIFYGTSGCGKTTCARIFASELNNYTGNPIEIDAASNNGVDNVKQIVKSAAERSLDSKYKIYIIDEAHALTNQAWQAFLKCIEEPPEYTKFIFCTTEKTKIPETVKNRCQIFNFNRISSELIRNRLDYICKEEKISSYSECIDYISRICNGEMRYGISILDQCIEQNTISIETIQKITGNFNSIAFIDLINSMIDGNEPNLLSIINRLYIEGNDLSVFVDRFIDFCLDISKYIIFNDLSVTKFPKNIEDKIKYCINFENASAYYMRVLNELIQLKSVVKNDHNIKSTIEVGLLKLTRCV